ncbi:MAG: undecaprenyl-diphosphate phosphatase [Ignisphaera sp.]
MSYGLLDSIVLGFIQGIFEWLPISSKTIVMLYSSLVLGKPLVLSYIVGLAIQGGTTFAAIAYFWREILDIISLKNKKLLMYVLITTSSTCLTGIPLYILFTNILEFDEEFSNLNFVTIAIGILLLTQAWVLSKLKPGIKRIDNIDTFDSLVLGFIQGLSAVPGISRSGVTIATLLYLGYTVDEALRLSFLASIPVNLGATILTLILEKLGIIYVDITSIGLASLTSLITGFTTIRLLLTIAKKYSYKLTIALGIITIVIGVTTTTALRNCFGFHIGL